MTKLTTTLSLIKEHKPCEDGLGNLLDYLGKDYSDDLLYGAVQINSEKISSLNKHLNKCIYCKKQPVLTYDLLQNCVFIECETKVEECRPMFFDLSEVLVFLLTDFLMNDFIKRWNTQK